MRKLSTISALLFLLLVAGQWASAQLLIEDFSYTDGALLTASGWTAGSAGGTNAITVHTASALTYSGYAGSGIGNGVSLTTSGEDDYKTYMPITSGTVYVSALVNLSAAQATGDYFLIPYGTAATGGGYFGRVFAKSSSTGFVFGLSKNNTTPTYESTVRTFGTTYLVVVKYTFVGTNTSTTTDDTVSLWVNPSIGSSEPPATIPAVGVGDKDNYATTGINAVALRQGNSSNAPTLMVDGIRVSTNWSTCVGSGPVDVFSATAFNFGAINVGAHQTDTLTVYNNSPYTAMNVSSVTSSDPTFAVTPTSGTVAISESLKFAITYSPTSVTANSAKVVFTSNDPTSPDTVSVSGSGIQAGFAMTPTGLGFGNVVNNTVKIDTVTVNNASTAVSLVIDSVRSSNALFTITPTSGTIGTSSSAKFAVSYSPTSTGFASGTIIFYHNAASKHDTLKVNGTSVLKAPAFKATPDTLNLKGVVVGQWRKDSITVKNTGYDSLFISAVTSSDPTFTITPTSARIDSQASTKFYVTFTPTALGIKGALLVFTSNAAEVKDTAMTSGRGIGNVPISEARKDLNSDLIPDHSVTGDTLLISGVITSKNLQSVGGQTAMYIQDSTGGIEIFGYALPPVTMVIGDSVFALGIVEQYHGLTEFYPLEPSYDVLDTLHFGILKHNATVPKPKHVTLHQYVATAESYEGLLVEIDTLYKASGTWPSVLTSAALYVTNASRTDTTEMYISSSTDIGGSIEPVYPINVVGVISQFSSGTTLNNGYELEPSDSLNITHTKFAPWVKISEARKDLNADLIADHSVTKDTLAVSGVITSGNLQSLGSQTAIFIQDSTAGIEIFNYSLPPVTMVIGDSVFVVGTVSQYRGAVEFTPLANDTLHFGVLKHKATVPKAKHLTLHQFVTNAESYEGLLVEIDTLFKASGTWPGAATGAAIYVTNQSKADTAELYISSSTDIGGSVEKTYPINVTAVINQYSSGSTVYNNGYEIEPSDTSNIVHQVVTKVDDAFSGIPTTFTLENNYPNPFNPTTTILYGLASQSHVTVKVYSVLGQEIATLVNDVQSPSYYRVVWNGTNSNGNMASSGVYFYRITAAPVDGKSAPFSQVKKMLLMK